MPQNFANHEQADFWSSPSGQQWVTHQNALDTLMSGVLDAILHTAAPQLGEHVLDIGCGTGASTQRLSHLVGTAGRVSALDISAPLLDLARTRAGDAGNVDFILGDAQTHTFDDQADLVFSRFGVMFFEDPTAAFINLRTATRPGGRLAMICWQGMPENPWFQIPFDAAVARLGRPSAMPPNAPGPTAFKDIDRVTGILADAGWKETHGQKITVDLIPPQNIQTAAEFTTAIGPASRTITEKGGSTEDTAAITAVCAQALAAYQSDIDLRVPARLIIYTGINPKG